MGTAELNTYDCMYDFVQAYQVKHYDNEGGQAGFALGRYMVATNTVNLVGKVWAGDVASSKLAYECFMTSHAEAGHVRCEMVVG